jgi:hypothetical protein
VDSEAFFEEIMGSSHFINSCGSLWGLERNVDTGKSDFLTGTQRLTGTYSIATLELGEDGWFKVTDDLTNNLQLAVNTKQRKAAWELLPDKGFSYLEAMASVKSAIRSSSTFHAWWANYLTRLGLVVPDGDNTYRKAGTPEKESM